MAHAQRHVAEEIGLTSELKKFPLIMGVMNVLGQVQLRTLATLNHAQVIWTFPKVAFVSDTFISYIVPRELYFLIAELIVFYCVVDCKWNDWIPGTCSKTCGGGTKTKTRTEKVSAEHGGKNCDGPSSAEENCNIQKCPGNERVYQFLLIAFLKVRFILRYTLCRW